MLSERGSADETMPAYVCFPLESSTDVFMISKFLKGVGFSLVTDEDKPLPTLYS